ncbi:hypothetical protein [Pseudoxanthomonas sp. USHLN014]|uniref:hypothetical protein n=1 Tax=Pseudoxanthomonas sp. USHLN014 TaxID=3081297 RepID=UPI00301C5F5A
MAAKVTKQDVLDAGFRGEQFGTPDDWAEDGGYLARVIDRASLWAKGRYGADYDAVAPETVVGQHLRDAELCYVSAKLWKARAAFIDSNAASSRDALNYGDRRQYLESAEKAMECAEEAIALAIGGVSPYPGTGVALVGVETGPFARRPCIGWPQ